MIRIPNNKRLPSFAGLLVFVGLGLGLGFYAFATPLVQGNSQISVSEPSSEVPHDKDYKIRKVVIDAGHGGHDPGCSGAKSKEKHIALNIALKLGAYIEERIPDVEVIYTRKTDVFVELHERAAIANRVNADLFISIHCNANNSHKPYGTETYVMGLHRNDANLGVAKRENQVIMLENDYNAHYDGFEPSTPNAHIIFSLFQSAYLEQSILFASLIENQFAKRVSRRSRGVKQAGFLVLYKTAMPSVLIETGFLSNNTEEKFLYSERGRDLMASAIFRAFRDYKQRMENLVDGAPVLVQNPPESEEATVVIDGSSNEASGSQEPGSSTEAILVSTSPTSEVEVQTDQTVPDYPTNADIKNEPPGSGTQEVQADPVKMVEIKVYLVQIYASSRIYKPTDPIFAEIQGEAIQSAKENDLYKYMVGEYADQETARLKKEELQQRGFKDAFVVSWLREVPIDLDQTSNR